MSQKTFDCYFCGGQVTAQQVDVMRQWKNRYILIENVPAYVCTQCGEQYYDGVIAEAMDRIMRDSETGLDIQREICVPVVEMTVAYPSPQPAHAAVQDKASD